VRAGAPSDVGAAVRATYAVFLVSGCAFATWASRIPQVKERFDLDASQLGLLLLAPSVGALIALPLSGPIVTRFGSRRTVAAMSVLAGTGIVLTAGGYEIGVAPVALALFVFGVALSTWDVAMNVQGAIVERRLGRSIMPRFHAAFSLGTVAGALCGTAMVALDVAVSVHLLVVGLAVALIVPVAAQRFADDHATPEEAAAAPTSSARASLDAWRERRTLLIGVFVLAFAFAEGAGNDWIGVAQIEDRDAEDAVGTLALAAFLAAMTAGRWFGPWALDRWGRVPVVRALVVTAIAGLLLFAFGPSTGVSFAGTLLWGAGISLGFPVGMSAAADDPAVAAARVSVVSSIGYSAFLVGPPLIGFLGHQTSVLHALSAVVVLLALAGLVAGNVRPLVREAR
jgi:fucose permease